MRGIRLPEQRCGYERRLHALAADHEDDEQEHLDAFAQRNEEDLAHQAVRISLPFCVTRRRYSRPLWVITSSLRAPSSVSLGTFAGTDCGCDELAGFII